MNYGIGLELEVSDTGISRGTHLRFHIDPHFESLQIYEREKYHQNKFWFPPISKKDGT